MSATFRSLANLLRRCSLEHADGQIGYFWSTWSLKTNVTIDHIFEALTNECRDSGPSGFHPLAVKIHEKYLKVFALLLLISHAGEIETFIDHEVNDVSLPLHYKVVLGEPGLYRQDSDEKPIECFDLCGWLAHDIEFFYQTQWRLTVPYFERSEDGTGAKHYNLPSQTILPWSPVPKVDGNETTAVTSMFSTVQRVRIHPCCHGFTEFLKENSLPDSYFAVKSPRGEDSERFHHEINILKVVGRPAHRHLISILATFSWNGSDHILMPYAECNLWRFWEINNGPLTSASKSPEKDMLWVGSQIVGLASALSAIHNGDGANIKDRPFIRHGDIKPGNVLCFESGVDSTKILVLTDFGISKSHELVTRLRGETDIRSVTLAYRAPESDMKDFKGSRSYDIWSLGCVFLEMAAWILGGLETLERVRNENGYGEPFFVVYGEGIDGKKQFSVKPGVIKCIAALHESSGCTEYMHDFLDIIENRMLLVNEHMRAKSYQLFTELERLQKKAIHDREYMMGSRPKKPPPRPNLSIKAEFNSHPQWRESLDEYRSTLGTKRLKEHKGKERCNPNILRDGTEVEEDWPRVPTYATQPPRDLTKEIKETVKQAFLYRPNVEMHEVFINVNWELQQCIRDELRGSCNLASVLTISGNASNSWAVSCLDYIKRTWGDLGVRFLRDLEAHLRDRDKTIQEISTTILECAFCPIKEEEAKKPQSLKFKGTAEEASTLSELISWVTATFRLPDKGLLSCSSIQFVSNSSHEKPIEFSISLQNLSPLQDQEPGTCWKVLFPSTVMAIDFPVPEIDFPVPESPKILGLQLPFDFMLQMAKVSDEVSLEDENGKDTGIYFDGISYVLYATHFDRLTNTIQWHVKKKSNGQEWDQAIAPDDGLPQKWKRDLDIKTLISAKAVLGYCDNVRTQLGTESRLDQFPHWQLLQGRNEQPHLGVNIKSLTVGANKVATVAVAAEFELREGLRVGLQEHDKQTFDDILEHAKKKWVILLDIAEGEERAWMVPKLSVILELFNYWAFRRKFVVKYANPIANDESEALRIFEDVSYMNRPIPKKYNGEEDSFIVKQVTDIIRRMNRLTKRNPGGEAPKGGIYVTFGNGSILGWDWLECVVPPDDYERRRVKNFENTCWMSLMKTMPVFLGENLGQLITPACENDLCRHWKSIPGGITDSYLVASAKAIKSISHRNNDQFNFGGQVWELKDESLFHACEQECKSRPEVCHKQPQTLAKNGLYTWSKKMAKKAVYAGKKMFGFDNQTENLRLEIPEDGAVAFSRRRKDEACLPAQHAQDVPPNALHEGNVQGVDNQNIAQGAGAEEVNGQNNDQGADAEGSDGQNNDQGADAEGSDGQNNDQGADAEGADDQNNVQGADTEGADDQGNVQIADAERANDQINFQRNEAQGANAEATIVQWVITQWKNIEWITAVLVFVLILVISYLE